MSQQLEVSLTVKQPREEVFGFFADAGNLERLTPPELRFRVLTPRPMTMFAGALIDYRLQLFGIPFAWQTLISHWEPPTCFVDEQLRGPYRKWVHTHLFRGVAGGTEIIDRVVYQLPLGHLGRLAQLPVARQLERIFGFRQQALKEIFSAGRRTDDAQS
jgi:ligand-binding SRPBCC domain-containing protein